MQKSGYVVIAALALMLLVTGPLAAQPTVTFNLTSPGSGENLAGIYTSPYSGNINSGPTIPVICDDFADDSYVPESWTAYVTSGSSVASETTTDGMLKWTGATVGSTTLNQAGAYTVAAVLAVEILQNTAPADATAEEELSYAMWALFDPAGTSGDPGALVWLADEGYNPSTFYSAVTTDLQNAVTYTLSAANSAQVQADINAVTIYSYDPTLPANPNGPTCGGTTCPNSPPQEFITVNMVEPPSPALLGFDLLAVTGLILFIRRRSKLTQA